VSGYGEEKIEVGEWICEEGRERENDRKEGERPTDIRRA